MPNISYDRDYQNGQKCIKMKTMTSYVLCRLQNIAGSCSMHIESLWLRRRDLRTHLYIATVIKFLATYVYIFLIFFLILLLDFIIVTINLIQLLAAILIRINYLSTYLSIYLTSQHVILSFSNAKCG